MAKAPKFLYLFIPMLKHGVSFSLYRITLNQSAEIREEISKTGRLFKGRFYQAFSVPFGAFSGQKHKRAIIQ